MARRNFWTYLRELGDVNDSNSSKSFALLVSTLTGGLLALAVCFILIFDVISNGHIETDLADLGIFLVCIGGYIAGSGVTKAVSERHIRDGHIGDRPRRRNSPVSSKPIDTEMNEDFEQEDSETFEDE